MDATLRRARDIVYWPHLNNDISQELKHCLTCQEAAPAQQKEPLLTHPTPTRPWERVAVDLFCVDSVQWLVIVDYYSDFWELNRLQSTSAEAIINKCKVHFTTHGIPDTVDSDNRPQFDCLIFKQFAKDWDFTHCTSSPYHHQANGKAESAVKIAKKLVKRSKKEKSDLQLAILEWRNTPTQGMQSSPVQRLMARRTRTVIPMAQELLNPIIQTGVADKIESRKSKIKVRYDEASKPRADLEEGQQVLVRLHPEKRDDLWIQGKLVRKIGPRSYLVEVNGREYRRNRRFIRNRV